MMRALYVILIALVWNEVCAQNNMGVKVYNLDSFTTQPFYAPDIISQKTTAEARRHPEYGIRPLYTQCGNCVELIDRRTQHTRYYINPHRPNYSYSQKSFFPLHYRANENSPWRTIDYRLQPTAQPGVYTAPNQPVPTVCNLNNQTTSLITEGLTFTFNQNLTAYWWNGKDKQALPAPNYNQYTIGNEGLRVKEFWPGIQLEQVFKTGAVKSNYVINAPLQLPVTDGWLVIEDHFTLPTGYTINPTEGGQVNNGKYRGDYVIKSPEGEALVIYEKPVFIDARAMGIHGDYELLANGNNYTLKMYVPVSWLSNPQNTYPIVIDPTVVGVRKLGDFEMTSGGTKAGMAFTTMALGSCDYYMTDTVPGMSQLTNAYVDLEYELTYDPNCGNPPLPAPFCTFSQVTMEVICDTCNTTTGLLACNPALPPFTGTCTTDPNLVPGASALLINNFTPNYLACLSPQCDDYELDFTLKNRDSTCGDVCGFLCATGNMWQMTIEACTVEGFITQDKTQVCAGEPVTFTANPNCGVPPYHFWWSADGGNTYDTVYGSPNFTIYPEADVVMSCVIFDTCENYAITNDLSVTVVASPPADAGPDVSLCGGGTAQIGGSPTTSSGANIQWSAETPGIAGWLSNANTSNPVATVPAGTVDTFFYAVRASDFTCFRRDTMWVYSHPSPTPAINTTGNVQICNGQSVTLVGQTGYAAYQWSNGQTTESITVNQPGTYSLTVTDQNGCTGTATGVTVSSITLPTVNAFPDTLIFFGDSVQLYTTYNLNSTIIDSFLWSPPVNLSCNTCTNPIVNPATNQYYRLVIYSRGCSAADSVLIQVTVRDTTVILPTNFYIPNAFTPNGDGNNDVFYIQTQEGVRVLEFFVFNRLGEKMHEGYFPWDGNYKNKPAPPGVYVYLFKLGLHGEDQGLYRKGSVTLIR